jgi:ATP adenylyltransferase
MPNHCLICAEHRPDGSPVGPRVWADDEVIVVHRAAGADGRSSLGDLYVASRRHVRAEGRLSEREAEATARALWLATCALRTELGSDLIFCAGTDRAVRHFHRHLYARHADPGPAESPDAAADPASVARRAGVAVDPRWPAAPRGDRAAVAALCARLSAHFPPVRAF